MFISRTHVPSISTFLPSDNPSHFSLDLSGVLAGLFGGDEALSALATVHTYGNRRWLGWYNTPGSFQIFKRLGSFMKSASETRLDSQTVDTDPTRLFDLDLSRGPKFRAAHSGTVMEETSYFASLFMRECAAWDSEGRVILGRRTQPVNITIADLGQPPAPELRPAPGGTSPLFFAGVPIAISIGTCALSAVFEDWFASWLILMGIVASGVFCLVLGSADFVFTHPVPAKGSPAGDGILGSGNDMVLLKGEESAVNAITRGRFSLRFSSKRHYDLIRWCSFLFFIQCVTQLLFIPQASLFGQVMFLTSLGVSAWYNARLSSTDKDESGRKFLFQRVLENPRLTKYTLGTRTSAVVFILLVLRPQDPRGLLDELLPNDTKVWKQWKETLAEWLRRPSEQSFQLEGKVGNSDKFTQQEKDLLALLYEDARAACNGYKDYLQADLL